LLDEVVDGHLAQEPHAGRYRLHDLLRAYATGLVETTDCEPDRRRATERLLDYYLHAVLAAGGPLEPTVSVGGIRPGEPRRPDLVRENGFWGTAWLKAERPNVVAAIHLATERGLDRYAWQLTRAVWQFLYSRGHTDDLLRTHHSGLAAAERLGDEAAITLTCNYLASAYYRIGRYQQAAEHVRRAVGNLQKAGDQAGEAIARKNLAVVYAEWGRHREAAAEGERALTTAREANNSRALATVVANLGAAYMMVGRFDAALRHCRNGLALLREARDLPDLAVALGNLGIIRARLGHHHQALRLLTVALAMKRRTSNRYGEAEALNELGAVHRALGDFRAAIAHHQEALAVVSEAGYRQGECAVRNEYGRTVFAEGDAGRALEHHQQALALAAKIQYRYGEARALDGIAACLRDTDPVGARRHWVRALQLYQELEVPERHEVERHLAALTVG
jgi:tetratricopeptide (TPR) repeat protein